MAVTHISAVAGAPPQVQPLEATKAVSRGSEGFRDSIIMIVVAWVLLFLIMFTLASHTV